MANNRYRLKPHEEKIIQNLRNREHNNVLVVGDLHAPFTRKGYLEHCIEVYNNYQCNQVVFIGDIIDNNRLKQERDAMMAMIPAMASQGGGGTSMPVINNSYSYQNTENTVREMPTTSSLNMMTALA